MSVAELNESREALESLLKKCEKAVEGSNLSPGRQTLMQRRIAALKTALVLIDEKLSTE